MKHGPAKTTIISCLTPRDEMQALTGLPPEAARWSGERSHGRCGSVGLTAAGGDLRAQSTMVASVE